MYANLYVEEPLEKVVEDWDFLHERVIGHFSTFKQVGQNVYGLRRRTITAEGVVDPRKGYIGRVFEMSGRGVTESSFLPWQLHVTVGGVPHHVEHNFGFWHLNDMDELYLPVPGPIESEPGYFIVMMGYPQGSACDRNVWYCQRCFALLYEVVYESGRLGFNGIWKFERDSVTAYNSDVKNRTCPDCGHVNPLGYCWNPSKNSPEEEAAREAW